MENCCIQSKNSYEDWNKVLQSIVPLRRIFSHLDLKHVKIVRLVCRHWADVGAIYLSGCTIFLDIYHRAPQQIAEFLAQHGIKHRLYLSTLSKPWDLIFDDRPSLKHWGDSKLKLKELKYSDNLASSSRKDSLNIYLQLSGHLVTELRLETSLNDEEDMNFLTENFKHLKKNLRKVTLDFSELTFILTTLPIDLIPQTAKTVTFRVYNEGNYFIGPHSKRFLEIVEPFVEFFDIIGWGKEKRRNYRSEEWGNWLEGVNLVIENKKNAFPCLKGVKGSASDDFLGDFFHGLSHQLEFIDMGLPLICSTIIRQMNQIIFKNRVALRRLAIKVNGMLSDLSDDSSPPYRPLYGFDPMDIEVDLYPLTNLQHLTLAIYEAPLWFEAPPQEFPQRLWDIFKLRRMLMDNLGQFPLLTSLCVIFTGPEDLEPREEFWDFMFPHTGNNGETLIINQLKELVVSYNGGCDSEINRRIRSMFPNLLSFRHVKEIIGDSVWGCEEHRNKENAGVTCNQFLVGTKEEIKSNWFEYKFLGKLFIKRLSIRRNLDVWKPSW